MNYYFTGRDGVKHTVHGWRAFLVGTMVFTLVPLGLILAFAAILVALFAPGVLTVIFTGSYGLAFLVSVAWWVLACKLGFIKLTFRR
jgi:hypothetical protein